MARISRTLEPRDAVELTDVFRPRGPCVPGPSSSVGRLIMPPGRLSAHRPGVAGRLFTRPAPGSPVGSPLTGPESWAAQRAGVCSPVMPFPQTRLRRLRATGALRGLVRETHLSPSDFVYPMFVAHGIDRREPIEAMPGHRPAVDRPRRRRGRRGETRSASPPSCCSACPRPRTRRARAPGTTRAIVQLATRAIKEAHPDLIVITDLCLCEYTSHGHCGVLASRTARSTTTRRSSCSPAPRRPRPAPAPTSSRPAT